MVMRCQNVECPICAQEVILREAEVWAIGEVTALVTALFGTPSLSDDEWGRRAQRFEHLKMLLHRVEELTPTTYRFGMYTLQ